MDEVERLCALLDREVEVCGTLTAVLRDEQDAMVARRPEAILLCVEQRGLLGEQLTSLASARRDVVASIATAHGAPTAEAIAVLPLLPPAPQARLRDRVRRLRAALLEARSLERQNAYLARASLDHVTDLLQTLRALVPGARYDANATLTVPDAPDRLSQRA